MKNLFFIIFVVLFSSIKSNAKYVVSGIVTDNEGYEMANILVKLKGTTLKTTTNIDGYYSIEIPDSSGTLIFSVKYFRTQIIEITSTQINAIMIFSDVLIGFVLVRSLGVTKPFYEHYTFREYQYQSYENLKLEEGYSYGKNVTQIRAEMLSEKRKLTKIKEIPILRYQVD